MDGEAIIVRKSPIIHVAVDSCSLPFLADGQIRSQIQARFKTSHHLNSGVGRSRYKLPRLDARLGTICGLSRCANQLPGFTGVVI